MTNAKRHPCACCGFLTLSGADGGSDEICAVCNWQDDGVQLEDPDFTGGANEESLNQARANFRELGAYSSTALHRVRRPLPDEIPSGSEPPTKRN